MCRLGIVVLAAAFLSACTSLIERPPADDLEVLWQRHVASLVNQSNWRVKGRVALRSQEDGWTAALLWTQRSERFDIQLAGPLGSGRLALRGDDQAVFLRASDGSVYRAEDAELLFREQFGFDIPVAGLRYWVLGLPRPGAFHSRALDREGRLERLVQDGWDIHFSAYARTTNLALPGKIYLSNPPFKVKLVVKQWTFL